MAALVADVGDFTEYSQRQFALHADAVVHCIRKLQIRIDRIDLSKGGHRRSGSAGDVRQIAVLELRAVGEGRDVYRRKDYVALGLVVVESETAANRRLVVTTRRVCKTDAR